MPFGRISRDPQCRDHPSEVRDKLLAEISRQDVPELGTITADNSCGSHGYAEVKESHGIEFYFPTRTIANLPKLAFLHLANSSKILQNLV